jgi:recombination protein RecR
VTRTPRAIARLIEAFSRLPGIGPKTAERFVYFLLRRTTSELTEMADAIAHLRETVQPCRECGRFDDQNPCSICRDPGRDASLLAVVAESPDAEALERTGAFSGRYHVLGGVLAPLEGISPKELAVDPLKQRAARGVREVILALNPDLEGEQTALFLARELKPLGIKVTRLARGLPLGSDIRYADDATLESALTGRRTMENGGSPKSQ